MGTGKGNEEKQREKRYEQQAEAAVAAWQPSQLETEETDRIRRLRAQLESGMDVKDIQGLSPYFNLYQNAARDNPDLAGQGLLGNNLLQGANANVASAIGQQMKARRQQEAAGGLYNAVQGAQADIGQQIPFLIGTEQSRMGNKARFFQDRYTQYMARPKKPSFWSQFAQGALSTGLNFGLSFI